MRAFIPRAGCLLLVCLLLCGVAPRGALAQQTPLPAPSASPAPADAPGEGEDAQENGPAWYLGGLILCGAVVFLEWRKRRILE